MKKRILFFLDSLGPGGKERRAVELFQFLKKETDFVLQIVLIENIIHYKYVFDLNIPIIVLKKNGIKIDISRFYSFFQIVKSFKPDIIHTWSGMATLYSIPTAKYYKIPLINNQIADAKKSKNRSLIRNVIWGINKRYSTLILGNSYSGIKAYSDKLLKENVIYNGVNLKRFKNLLDKNNVKKQFGINTVYSVVMVATFSHLKDYNLFFKVAEKVCDLRNDVTFIAVGAGALQSEFIKEVKNYNRILLFDEIINVEELVNSIDIGVLFSGLQTGEGISNTIMEYMALTKPVIATDSGGTPELVVNNISGFLVKKDVDQIVHLINDLLNSSELRKKMGKNGRHIIESNFTIDHMGSKFLEIYRSF